MLRCCRRYVSPVVKGGRQEGLNCIIARKKRKTNVGIFSVNLIFNPSARSPINSTATISSTKLLANIVIAALLRIIFVQISRGQVVSRTGGTSIFKEFHVVCLLPAFSSSSFPCPEPINVDAKRMPSVYIDAASFSFGSASSSLHGELNARLKAGSLNGLLLVVESRDSGEQRQNRGMWRLVARAGRSE